MTWTILSCACPQPFNGAGWCCMCPVLPSSYFPQIFSVAEVHQRVPTSSSSKRAGAALARHQRAPREGRPQRMKQPTKLLHPRCAWLCRILLLLSSRLLCQRVLVRSPLWPPHGCLRPCSSPACLRPSPRQRRTRLLRPTPCAPSWVSSPSRCRAQFVCLIL